MSRKFRSGGSTSEQDLSRSKKYKYNSSGTLVEATSIADDDIIFSGSKSNLRRMADLERNISILANKLLTTDGAAEDSDDANFENKFTDDVRFKAETQFDDVMTIKTTMDASAGTVKLNTWQIGGVTVSASAAELNKMDGVSASTTELNYMDGVTSNVQTQMNTKAPTANPTFTGTVSGVSASHVGLGNVTNESKATMFSNPTFTGNVTAGGHMLPDADVTYDLGSSSRKWRDLYLSGNTIKLGSATIGSTGTGLNFGGDLDLGTNKVLFSNMYSTSSALPSASSYHGMFAHVHDTGLAYYAHNGSWLALARDDHKIASNADDSASGIISFTNTQAATSATTGAVRISGGLGVGGSIYASGDVTAYSDESLKTNIKTIANGLDKVMALRGITFDRIADGSTSTGVSAQDVAAVLPEAVSTDNEGLMAVKYGNLVGLLIEAIKDLKSEVNDLKAVQA